jgi:cytochrome c biogenesis protein CcdA/thiol-disulfide isomerase/thioredoxin
MSLFVLAFLGGVLTILSPCILPVLPFVLTTTGEPFRRSGLPLLLGMAVTFALVGSLAAVGGGWAVQANRWGRFAALALLFVFGLALLLPRFAASLSRPFVLLGNKLTAGAVGSPRSSLVLGIATGLLWTPCAGPILGLILTGAALGGANVETTMLLLAYAAGGAGALAAALLLGGKAFTALKRSLGAEALLRRGLGAAVVVGTLAIGLGLDTGLLARVSTASTSKLEQALFGRLMPKRDEPADNADVLLPESALSGNAAMMRGGAMMAAREAAAALPVAGVLPELAGATAWLNSEPLTREGLRGKVVLIDFWTYSCINCIRALPYVKAWHEKYRDRGFVVIGIHAPEFAFEKELRNVRREVAQLGIEYAIAVDNDFVLWRAFSNQYWPAHYFVDAMGNIRHTHFGEGEYERSERVIQDLLAEAAGTAAAINRVTDSDFVDPEAHGAALASDPLDVLSPETYIGHARAENFVSPGGQAPGVARSYETPARLMLNQWAFGGRWTVSDEHAALDSAPGKIVFRFRSRDLHLVLGPATRDERALRFRVRLDGTEPGPDHGTDIGADGTGAVGEQRLYQLIRQSGEVRERTFEIEFLDPGVAAYAFTFG